jgi:hypothetical protein
MSNPYRILGLSLILAGVIFAPISLFLMNSVLLTATGISAIIIGFSCVALANTRPYISPEACETMLKTGMENTAALLEELGLKNKAVYLPSSMRDGHPQALIPLADERTIQQVKGKIPGRLIVRYGARPDDMAIAVTTPGGINIDMLETRPGASPSEIETAISYILVGVLDLASSVSVSMSDNRVNVEVKEPRLHYEDVWYYRCLGSPLASIAATISSEALSKPVMIGKESYEDGRSRIEIEVLS